MQSTGGMERYTMSQHGHSDQILLVDHEEDRRGHLRELLEERSYQTIEAGSCEEAMTLMAKKPPALVITETDLPKKSGLFLLRQVKEVLPETEVILITHNASSYNVLQALRHGAYDFIVRPIDTGEILNNVLDRVFKQIHLRRQNGHLLVELERNNRQLQRALNMMKVLNSSIEKVSAAREVEDLFMELLTNAMQAIQARKGILALFDRNCSQLGIKVSQGITPAICQRYSNALPDGLVLRLAQRGGPLLVPGKLSSKFLSKASSVEQDHLIDGEGLLVAPLRMRARTVGIVVLSGHQEDRPFSEQDLDFLIQLSHHAALALEKAGIIHQLKRQGQNSSVEQKESGAS